MLKDVKEPPLLASPVREQSGEITKEDLRLIIGALDELRNKKLGSSLAKHHIRLRELGLQQPVTTKDKRLLKAEITSRRKHFRNGVVSAYHDMWSVGLKEQVEERDLVRFNEQLDKNTKERKGANVAYYLVHMRGAGLSVQITREHLRAIDIALKGERAEPTSNATGFYIDLKEIGLLKLLTDGERDVVKKVLNAYRNSEDGEGVGRTHHQMGELEFGESVTASDRQLMMLDLNRFRKEKDGERIAEMHVHLRRILPLETQISWQPLPPLKRFGGER